MPETIETKETTTLKPSRYSMAAVFSDERLIAVERDKRIYAALLAVAVLSCVGLAWKCATLGASVKTVQKVYFPDQEGVRYAGEGREVRPGDSVWEHIRSTNFRTFVSSWREVTTDLDAQNRLWDKANGFIGANSQAEDYLRKWYLQNRPDARAQKEVDTVYVESAQSVAENTYEVIWSETVKPHNAPAKPPQYWNAKFTYVFDRDHMRVLISQISIAEVVREEKHQ